MIKPNAMYSCVYKLGLSPSPKYDMILLVITRTQYTPSYSVMPWQSPCNKQWVGRRTQGHTAISFKNHTAEATQHTTNNLHTYTRIPVHAHHTHYVACTHTCR